MGPLSEKRFYSTMLIGIIDKCGHCPDWNQNGYWDIELLNPVHYARTGAFVFLKKLGFFLTTAFLEESDGWRLVVRLVIIVNLIGGNDINGFGAIVGPSEPENVKEALDRVTGIFPDVSLIFLDVLQFQEKVGLFAFPFAFDGDDLSQIVERPVLIGQAFQQ